MATKLATPAKRNARTAKGDAKQPIEAGQDGGTTKQPAAGSDTAAGKPGIDGITVIGDGGKAEASKHSGLAPVKGDIPAPAGKSKKPPTKKGKAPKSNDMQLTADMLASLLGVVFNLMAVRMGDHWRLSAEEAMALAEPTSRILDRYDLTKKTGAYADFIALGVAVTGIVIPKVMMEMSKPKKPRKGVVTHVESIQQQQNQRNDRRDVGHNTVKREESPNPSVVGGIDRSDAANGANAGIKNHLGSVIPYT